MLSQQQISHFWDEGFVVVPDAVPLEAIQKANTALELLLERSRAVNQSDSVFDLEDGHSSATPRVRRIKEPHLVDPAFESLLNGRNIIDVVAQLLGPNLRMEHTKLNIKPAMGGEPVEWHQDWVFYPYTNDDILEVGVMLADTELENGPLMMIPRSHRGPVYEHNANGYFVGAIDVDAENLDVSSAVPCIGRPGSISLHHVRTVHGSAANMSGRPRPVLLLGYCAADAWPLRDGAFKDLDSFNARMVRGQPTLQPRLKAVPVRMPYPIAPEQGWKSIFETQKSIRGRNFRSS